MDTKTKLGLLGIPEDCRRLLVSFSGGRTSALMGKRVQENLFDSDVDVQFVFANTGLEREETLEFVRDCDKHFGFNTTWIEAVVNPETGKGTSFRVVSFESASRHGQPFEQVIRKYGIPNVSFPHCSRELKKKAIRSYARVLYGGEPYYTAIGIRADEFDRASSDCKKEKIVYPLISLGVQKLDVSLFWESQSFKLRLKDYEGNCSGCWKKSFKKLCTLALERPQDFDFFRDMEEKYGEYRPANQPRRPLPARFFRGNRTVEDIEVMSQAPNFTKAEDGYSLEFMLGADEMTASSGCEDSCEAF